MLVLTRKSNESVVLGNNIVVTVLGVHGDQVRLGFSAPSEMSIHRKEVFDAILEENRAAAGQNHGGMDALKGLFGRSTKK